MSGKVGGGRRQGKRGRPENANETNRHKGKWTTEREDMIGKGAKGLPLVTSLAGWLGSEGSVSKPGTATHGKIEGPNQS